MENKNALINEIIEHANKLNSKALDSKMELINQAIDKKNEKLQLMIIGSNAKSAIGLSNQTIKRQVIEDSKYMYDNDFMLDVHYDESDSYKIYDEVNGFVNISKELFFEKLYSDSSLSIHNKSDLYTKSEILKLVDIKTVMTDYQMDDKDLYQLLLDVDYLVIVLSVDKLLSQQERFFLTELVKPLYNTNRVRLIINDDRGIDFDEKNEVMQYIADTLEYYEYEVPVDYYCKRSGAEINIHDNFTDKNIIEIKNHSYKDKINLMIHEINKTNTVAKDTDDVKLLELQKIIDTLNHNKDAVNKSKAKNINRVNMYVKEAIKSEVNKVVNEYKNYANKQFDLNVIKEFSTNEIKTNASKYIRYIWNEFAAQQESWIKKRIVSEMVEINKVIEKDLLSLCGNNENTDVNELIQECLGNEYVFSTYYMHKREKSSFTKQTNLLGLASVGIMALVSLPIGLVGLGSTIALKAAFNKQTVLEEKQAICDSIIESNNKAAGQIIDENEVRFDKIVTSIAEEINSKYDEAVNTIGASISKKIDEINRYKQLKEYIHYIENEKIPEWKILLK